ncbi:MAG: hypothetical protein CVU11_02430 [Bacteroidetes bacterium HGW-Bacteroidetes-6]|nr:MAG: hypothetical protein CVU11_02430 [Bacteroidetes bacterium HGW-Bacteroidetes-6]
MGTYIKYGPLLSISDSYSVSGKVRYYSNTLQIDKEKFTVVQVPTLNDSIWTMQIEDIVYTKRN